MNNGYFVQSQATSVKIHASLVPKLSCVDREPGNEATATYCIGRKFSHVPRPYPGFHSFSLLQAMESWAGPWNKVRHICYHEH